MGLINKRFLDTKDVIDIVFPIGASYIQFAGAPLPGDELLSYEDAVIEDYTDEELEACLYPGTKWKLAVRNGDFLRQKGTRVIDEENAISIGSENIGDEQEDAMQRITGDITYTDYSPMNSSANVNGVFSESIYDDMNGFTGAGSSGRITVFDLDSANSTSPYSAKTDDYETRPTNTAVVYWMRVA